MVEHVLWEHAVAGSIPVSLIKENQMTETELYWYGELLWFAGATDGEGCFNIGIHVTL